MKNIYVHLMNALTSTFMIYVMKQIEIQDRLYQFTFYVMIFVSVISWIISIGYLFGMFVEYFEWWKQMKLEVRSLVECEKVEE